MQIWVSYMSIRLIRVYLWGLMIGWSSWNSKYDNFPSHEFWKPTLIRRSADFVSFSPSHPTTDIQPCRHWPYFSKPASSAVPSQEHPAGAPWKESPSLWIPEGRNHDGGSLESSASLPPWSNEYMYGVQNVGFKSKNKKHMEHRQHSLTCL